MVSLLTKISLGLCIASLPGPVLAMDSEGNFAIRGVGSATCTQFVATYDEGETAGILRVIHWMQGYFSARNKIQDGVFDAVPVYNPDQVASLINAVCRNNRDARIETAAHGIIALFENAWLSSPSDLVSLDQGGASLEIRSAILAQIQQALADRGLYSSSVDGVYGARTAEALRRYQAAEGFSETGLPDLPTLVELLKNEP